MALAGKRGGQIVNADSMQVYRGMDIGTAKPTLKERQCVPHHLLDVVEPDEPFDVSRYIGAARGIIDGLHREGRTVFVVGGTGLYIRALTGGLIDGPGADESLRKDLKEEMTRLGKPHLYEKLCRKDPRAAARINPNDGVRIIRALEVLELTGRSIVEYQEEHRFQERPFDVLKIGLAMDREELNERIDTRTERMVADGFVEEVRRLLGQGYDGMLKPMQSLGYRHLVAHLAGQKDLKGAVGLIKRDTRHYARRQMTWFSADPEVLWLAPKDIATADEKVSRFLERP